MPTKRNKRGAASPLLSPTPSPTAPPIRNIAMEESLASLHAKFDSFGTQLAKIDVLEQTISTLVQENIACREELRKKDVIIDQLSEKVNRLEQLLPCPQSSQCRLPRNYDAHLHSSQAER
jgi:hypothetical protein